MCGSLRDKGDTFWLGGAVLVVRPRGIVQFSEQRGLSVIDHVELVEVEPLVERQVELPSIGVAGVLVGDERVGHQVQGIRENRGSGLQFLGRVDEAGFCLGSF